VMVFSSPGKPDDCFMYLRTNLATTTLRGAACPATACMYVCMYVHVCIVLATMTLRGGACPATACMYECVYVCVFHSVCACVCACVCVCIDTRKPQPQAHSHVKITLNQIALKLSPKGGNQSPSTAQPFCFALRFFLPNAKPKQKKMLFPRIFLPNAKQKQKDAFPRSPIFLKSMYVYFRSLAILKRLESAHCIHVHKYPQQKESRRTSYVVKFESLLFLLFGPT
jgi:hypothetical protein